MRSAASKEPPARLATLSITATLCPLCCALLLLSRVAQVLLTRAWYAFSTVMKKGCASLFLFSVSHVVVASAAALTSHPPTLTKPPRPPAAAGSPSPAAACPAGVPAPA